LNAIVQRITARLRHRATEAAAPEETLPVGRTLDYSRPMWGHSYVVHHVLDEGRELRCSGWGPSFGARIVRGDCLILQGGEPGVASRYQVVEISHHMDPPDMWAATLRHLPEGALAKGQADA
jgi:hypothetical protein